MTNDEFVRVANATQVSPVETIARLQRRVEELEALALHTTRVLTARQWGHDGDEESGQHEPFCEGCALEALRAHAEAAMEGSSGEVERLKAEAAEQRKRAEEAEDNYKRLSIDALSRSLDRAAAIEKARQEEREVLMERAVETLQTCFPLPASKWTPGSLIHATAALRALKGA